MNWNELKNQIEKMSDEQRDTDVTVTCLQQGEIFAVIDFVTDWTTEKEAKGIDLVEGVLDDNHPYLAIDA